MTLMLASVLDAHEAELAVRCGADIVDFEDSRRGPLAASSFEAIEAGVSAVAGRSRTSAALGAPPYEPANLAKRARALAAAGVNSVKLAIDEASLDPLEGTLKALAREVALVGVLWADRARGFDCLPRLASIGFKAAMLDTVDKAAGRLLDHRTPAELEAFQKRRRECGLEAGFAGSLEAPDVPRLMLLQPSVLAFRRALCTGRGREGPLDERAILRIRGLIPQEADPDAADFVGAVPSSSMDGRPSGLPLDRVGRGPRPGRQSAAESETDLVFIRDFHASADLGAYRREHGRPQRVVFNVEASVERAKARADDMRAIFSYDVILDAIRLVIGRGHVNFVETIVEDVAEIVLRHPRVIRVKVRAEKLDVIEGAVGVEIVRERAR